MEYTQWAETAKRNPIHRIVVLILVVMEYTQWEDQMPLLNTSKLGLNPCCNGIYSMSGKEFTDSWSKAVLILVVMEYTQWVWWFQIVEQAFKS